MCGIVGYFGKKPALSILTQSLEQIEYRGYDSAGVAFLTTKGFQRIRSLGPLSQLKKKISSGNYTAYLLGIGHTRWATHGIPNEANAHPHQSGPIYIVHNGIVENFQKLKSQFSSHYESQTDTEVIAKCIHHNYTQHSHFLQAVIDTNQKLKGSYSFLTVCDHDRECIIGYQNGPPLAVGMGEKGEFFISSDLPSLLDKTPRVYILENQEMFVIQNHQCQFMNHKGTIIQKKLQTIQQKESVNSKKKYEHYMLKEIHDQPESIQNTINHYLDSSDAFLIQKENLNSIQTANRLSIIACGSSYYAALYGKYVIEYLTRIPVNVDLASEFQYRKPIIHSNEPILFISQSGETADILSSFRKAKQEGAIGLSLCNVKNSSLDRMSDTSFYLHAGKEIAVASTKAFSSTLTALVLIALQLSKNKSTNQQESQSNIVKDLKHIPALIQNILSQSHIIKNLVTQLTSFNSFLFLGRGLNYPIALEGALKMKELAYIHAEGYPSGEMKHGPLALVNDQVLVIGLMPNDHYYFKNLMNLEEAKAREAKILTIGHRTHELQKLSLHHIEIPSTNFVLSGILEVVSLQLLAYYFAHHLGYNIDRPRNLAKSVTVE